RKQMIEELSIAMAKDHVGLISAAYTSMMPLFEGALPNYGDQDNSLLFSQYMIVTGIWLRASEEAEKAGAVNSSVAARKIILTQERKFMDALYKDMKEALVDYSDEALAHLVADKRVKDYKRAFEMREVADTDALGSTTWIMQCDRVNRAHVAQYPPIERLLATHYLSVLAHGMAELAKAPRPTSSTTPVTPMYPDAATPDRFFDGIVGERA
ncbi:MAG: hypothetical protein AAF847_04900, partial [Bacteroidota bacterium]